MNLQTELSNEKARTAQLNSRIAELEAQIGATPKAEDAVASATTALNQELARVRGELSTSQAEATRLQGELTAARTDIDARVAARAAEISQTQGNVPPMSFKTKENPASAGKTSEALWTEYRQIKDLNEKNAFYKKNRDAMRDK